MIRFVHFALNSGTNNQEAPQKVSADTPNGLKTVPFLLPSPRMHTSIAANPHSTYLCLKLISSVAISLISVIASGSWSYTSFTGRIYSSTGATHYLFTYFEMERPTYCMERMLSRIVFPMVFMLM